ncbi:MAG: dynamin family protein [Microcoleaceae cyanobacterium]
MNNQNSQTLMNDLEKVVRARYEISENLRNISAIITNSEAEAEKISGKLGIELETEHLSKISENLKQGRFRLLVLGDLKRGKSTFLNALIGEKILPSDVNPCTALLTVLRYGEQKKVTIYFKDGTIPQKLDFNSFKQQYTIDPDESKKLQSENKLAFPNVEYALIEYPLPLLGKGIEIIDTPGLNDTEARNKLSLSYINNSHAILFVFRASQPCTLDERRYLETYLKDRGLTVFFLINAWDEIRKGLTNQEDKSALLEAEEKLRQVFQINLAEYCHKDGNNIYEQRVFEINSLEALRRQIKNPQVSLEGTGFPQFLDNLNNFLTQERTTSQLRQAKVISQQVYNRLHEAVERRIPLLGTDIKELKEKINSVEPEFTKLIEIRDQFQAEITVTKNRQAKAVADSLSTYILNLGNTFETDFVRYQPNLAFLDFLQRGKREEFQLEFQQAFERYIQEKLAEWELSAERKIGEAFEQLAESAASYGEIYNQIANLMSEKLIGENIHIGKNIDSENNTPSWASWAMGFFSLAQGNVAGVALAGAGFEWKNILVNYLAVIGISSFLLIFTGGLLVPIGIWAIPILGLGVGAFQAEEARKELMKVTKKELIKYLPKLAESQWESIHQTVIEYFEDYEREVMKRINDDIESRRSELDNLVKQKESSEIDREKEAKRLEKLDAHVLSECRNIELIYNYVVVE